MPALRSLLATLVLASTFGIGWTIDHDRGTAAVFGALLAGAGCGLWAMKKRAVA